CLQMNDTDFWPLEASRLPGDQTRFVPTEPDESGTMLRGVVHDPRARKMGGMAGHAGLFGTADDLAVYCQMLLNGGVGLSGARILSPLTVRKMLDPGDTPPRQR